MVQTNLFADLLAYTRDLQGKHLEQFISRISIGGIVLDNVHIVRVLSVHCLSTKAVKYVYPEQTVFEPLYLYLLYRRPWKYHWFLYGYIYVNIDSKLLVVNCSTEYIDRSGVILT